MWVFKNHSCLFISKTIKVCTQHTKVVIASSLAQHVNICLEMVMQFEGMSGVKVFELFLLFLREKNLQKYFFFTKGVKWILSALSAQSFTDHPTEKCDSVNDPRAVCQNGGFCFFDPNCCKINGTDCEQANCGENGNPFICQCPPGYHGYRCEISCEPVNPIRNGSTVTLVVNESCPLSYISEPCAAPFKWWPGSPPNSPLLLQMAAVPRELSNTFTCSENRTVVVVQYPPEIQPGRGGTECMTNQIPCGINEGVSFSPTERYLWEIVSTTPGACGTCKHNYSQSPVTNESLFNGTPSNVNCYRQLEQKPFEFQLSMCEGDSNPAACYRCSVSSVFGSLHRDIGFIPPTGTYYCSFTWTCWANRVVARGAKGSQVFLCLWGDPHQIPKF